MTEKRKPSAINVNVSSRDSPMRNGKRSVLNAIGSDYKL